MRGLLLIFAAGLSSLTAWSKGPEWERAHELYQRTEYAQALSILNQIHDKDADTLQLTGQCYFMRGDYKQATEAFEKALEKAPRNSELHRLLGNTFGRRAETGSVFTAPGNAKKALQQFELAVELDPNNREAAANLFEYYLEAPGILGGGIEKAEALIRNIAKLSPPAALHAQAQLESKRKRYDVAEAELRRAMQAEPKDPGRVIDLARFLSDRGQAKESDELFAQASRMSPDSPQLLYARAETYIHQKRNLAEARQLLERYLASPLTPDDPPRDNARALLSQAGN